MFCVYTAGSGFQKWFETFEEAKSYALYVVQTTGEFDRIHIGDEYDCWGHVDHDGYHVHEDIF